MPNPPSASSTPIGGDDLFVLEISAKLKRCGGEIKLILPSRPDAEIVGREAPSLLKAIARAYDWRERIMNGSVKDLRPLAVQTGIDARYLGRILKCAFLAPDIVEAILNGRQPPDLSAQNLCSALPPTWAEQRKRLGFRPAGT